MKNFFDFWESIKPSEYEGYKVRYIDAKKFRGSSLPHEEFCTIAIHEDFPDVIGKDEIWVDRNIKTSELNELLSGAVKRYKGMSYSQEQKDERKIRKKHEELIDKKLYFKFNDIKVYLVSGKAVRDHYKTDFSQGGHGQVYNWIPHGEIWLEREELGEYWYILAHEYYEMLLMKGGMPYIKAHEKASAIEEGLRHKKFGSKEFKSFVSNIKK